MADLNSLDDRTPSITYVYGVSIGMNYFSRHHGSLKSEIDMFLWSDLTHQNILYGGFC